MPEPSVAPENVAVPLLSVAVPNVVAPSLNVTVPVDAAGVTKAVMVKFEETVNVVVVGAAVMPSITKFDCPVSLFGPL